MIKKMILLVLSVFLLSIATVTAAVDDISVSLTPKNPLDSTNLNCGFTVNGDETEYNTTVEWIKNDELIQTDNVTVADGIKESVTLAESKTEQGDSVYCKVSADSVTEASDEILLDTKLKFDYISAKCSPSCNDDDLDDNAANDGDAGRIKEVQPGSDVTLKLRVENLWPDDTDDHDINDINVDCTLEDIGDDDEVDDDVDFSDLNPGENSDKEELVFKVSEQAEDNKVYTTECTLTGEDDDGTDYDFDFKFDIKVKKEKHKVVFKRAEISPSTVSCNRNFNIDYKIQNIGAHDEDDISIRARNSALGELYSSLLPDIQEGDYDDEDTEYSDTLTLSIDNDVEAGNYELILEIFYDNNDENSFEKLELAVEDCEPKPTPVEEPKEKQDEKTDVVVVPQPIIPTTQTPIPVITQQPEDKTEQKEQSVAFTDSIWFIVVLIVVIVFLLSLALWMLAQVFKK